MTDYFHILLGFGICGLLMAYIPVLSEKLRITYSIPLLILGTILYYLGIPVNWPEPFWEHKWVKIVTELIVVLSLTGAGLRIGFKYGREHWKNPLRLIHTAMPIYMLFIAAGAYYLLDFDLAHSILLAAVCAPTDPVVASEMQLEDDGDAKGKDTGLRYLLTAEAGLNDGLAFPFVYLAILLSKAEGFGSELFWEWAGYYFLYKIIVGAAIGALIGYLYSWGIKRLGANKKDKGLSGCIVVTLAISSFALGETVSAYGFLSAFFAGLFAQYHHHRSGEEHSKGELVLFAQEFEKLLIIIWLLLFGGFLANGILTYVGTLGICLAFLIVLAFRPLAGMLSLIGAKLSVQKKWAISFFGIKGVGCFFYLAYALMEGEFTEPEELYALVSWTVLISIVVHGLSGIRVLRYFEKSSERQT